MNRELKILCLICLFLSLDVLSVCYMDSYKYNCYSKDRLYYSGTMQTSNESNRQDSLYVGNTFVNYLALTGYGTYYYKGGDTYTGNFLTGKRHGNGTYEWQDGRRHTGSYKLNKFHGKGKFYNISGKLTYDGNYANDKKEGFGKSYIYGDNWYYMEGVFKDSDPVGLMTVYFQADHSINYATSKIRTIDGLFKFTGKTTFKYHSGAIKRSNYSSKGEFLESEWIVSPQQAEQNKLNKERKYQEQMLRDLDAENERKRKQQSEDKIYDACILDKIPDAKTESAADLLRQSCRDISKNPTNWQRLRYLGFEGLKEMTN